MSRFLSLLNLRNACFAAAALCLASIGFSTPSAPPPADPDLVRAVRADLAKLRVSADGTVDQVKVSNELLSEIRDLITAIKEESRGKRVRGTVDSAATTDLSSEYSAEPSPPIVLRSPAGVEISIASLTAAASDRFTVSGMTYREALVFNGFAVDQVATLDDETCQKVYQGWKATQPVLHASRGGRVQVRCVNGQCNRVR